jgi:hypothetical protein
MAPPPSSEAKIEEAKKLSKQDPSKAEALYKDVLSKSPGTDEAAMRDYETALVGLGELYRDHKRQHDLAELVKSSRSAIQSYARAKTAKLSTSTFCRMWTLLTTFSSTAARLLQRHSRFPRSPDSHYEVMHRMEHS